MKTRTSWRNQDRLWRALGAQGSPRVLTPLEGRMLESLRELLRALDAHIDEAAAAAGVARADCCPCDGEECSRARALIAEADGYMGR